MTPVEIARDLAELAARFSAVKREATNDLTDTRYGPCCIVLGVGTGVVVDQPPHRAVYPIHGSGTISTMVLSEGPLQLTLVFDGTCGFCMRSVRLLEALDHNRRVTAVPFQKSGVPASVGLTVEECEATVWAIASDGGRYRGAEAVNAVVAAALGTTGPLLLYSLPGIGQLQDIIYYLVASNRGRLPGDRPYCAQRPAECR